MRSIFLRAFALLAAIAGVTAMASAQDPRGMGPIAAYLPNTQAAAWVTVSGGVVTNVKTTNAVVARTAAGKFTVTMASAAADANYRVMITGQINASQQPCMEDIGVSARSTTVFGIGCINSGGYADPTGISITVLP